MCLGCFGNISLIETNLNWIAKKRHLTLLSGLPLSLLTPLSIAINPLWFNIPPLRMGPYLDEFWWREGEAWQTHCPTHYLWLKMEVFVGMFSHTHTYFVCLFWIPVCKPEWQRPSWGDRRRARSESRAGNKPHSPSDWQTSVASDP